MSSLNFLEVFTGTGMSWDLMSWFVVVLFECEHIWTALSWKYATVTIEVAACWPWCGSDCLCELWGPASSLYIIVVSLYLPFMWIWFEIISYQASSLTWPETPIQSLRKVCSSLSLRFFRGTYSCHVSLQARSVWQNFVYVNSLRGSWVKCHFTSFKIMSDISLFHFIHIFHHNTLVNIYIIDFPSNKATPNIE